MSNSKTQSKHDMLYMCTNYAKLKARQANLRLTRPIKYFVVSRIVYEFHQKYIQDNLGITIPKPDERQAVRIGRAECMKIWKAMNTHGRSAILGQAQVFFPTTTDTFGIYTWASRSIFEQAGEIHILRYREERNWKEQPAVLELHEKLFNIWRKQQDWQIP